MAQLLSVQSREDSAFPGCDDSYSECTRCCAFWKDSLIFGRLPFRVKRVILEVRRPLPVYPQLRTYRCTALSDAMCQQANRKLDPTEAICR
jgi:hypothetical protein